MVSYAVPTSTASCVGLVRCSAAGLGITGVLKGISMAASVSTPVQEVRVGKSHTMAFFSRAPSAFGVVSATITCSCPCHAASYAPALVAISPNAVRMRLDLIVSATGFGSGVSKAKSPSISLSARLSRRWFVRYGFGALAFSISGFTRPMAVPAWSPVSLTRGAEAVYSAGCSRPISAATFRAAKTGPPISRTFMGICRVSRTTAVSICMGFPTLGSESGVSRGCAGTTTGISSFTATCVSAAPVMAQEQNAIAGF